MNLSDINTVREIMSRHGLNFSKSLGQNFIIDPEVCPEIVRQSGIDEQCGVIEIGPGIGVLTVEIAKKAKKVVCIELDKRLLPVLDETLGGFKNVEVVNADVMKVDLKALIDEKFGSMPVRVCANLPYYITSPVIMNLLECRLPLESITVMVQKEAGDRLCAPVGSRDAGAVTAAVNFYARAQKLFFVGRNSFLPAPSVDSVVINLELRKEKPVSVENEKIFFRLIRAAFGQRRKTALNSISSGMGIPKESTAKILRGAGFDTNVRAENFSLEDFARLEKAFLAEFPDLNK